MASIRTNAGRLFAGRVVAQGLTVLFTIVLARRLGPAGFGGYAFVASAVFLANVVTTFGTDMVLIRDAAASGRTNRWGAALAVQLGLSAFAVLAFWLVAPLVSAADPGAGNALRVYSLSLFPAALYSVCSAVLRGVNRMSAYAVLGVAIAAIQLVALWLLPAGASLTSIVAMLLGVQLAAAVLAWAFCAQADEAFRALPAARRADVVEMVRATATIGVLGLLGMAYQRAAVLALSVIAGPAATGWFAGASKVVEASKTGHVALFGALYPALAEAHGEPAEIPGSAPRRAPTAGELRWAWRISIVGAAAISADILVASPLLVPLLYGPSFAPSVPALAILALSVLPAALSGFQSIDLVAAHRESLTLRAQALSLATLLALLAALVPAIGWLGACWAVLGAEIVQAAALYAARRGLGFDRENPIAAETAAAR